MHGIDKQEEGYCDSQPVDPGMGTRVQTEVQIEVGGGVQELATAAEAKQFDVDGEVAQK